MYKVQKPVKKYSKTKKNNKPHTKGERNHSYDDDEAFKEYSHMIKGIR